MSKEILCLSMNQDRSIFTCGLENGFRAFNVDPLAQLYSQDIPDCGGIGKIHILNRTNLIAIVGNGRHMKYPKNRVFIWDAEQKKSVLELTFGSPVFNIKLCKDIILVVLENHIYAYTFPNNPDLLFSYPTRDNPKGILEISCAIDNQWCVLPGTKSGSIQLIDLHINQISSSYTPCIINAHQHEIACIAINQHGTLVATASTKGTLIRLFEIKTKRQTIELRRGTDPASLYCISFSSDSAFLCASSDKGTVHIFAIKDQSKNKRSTLSKVGFFGSYAESQWGLTNFSVQSESPCLCVFGPETSVIAICYDGSFHKYVFTKDGSCNREAYDMFLDLGDDEDFWELMDRVETKTSLKKLQKYIDQGRVRKILKLANKFRRCNQEELFLAKINKCRGKSGRTYLIKYCSKGDIPMVQTLLKAGADFTICDTSNNSALHVGMNYVLKTFDRHFFGDIVLELMKLTHDDVLKVTNKYGESPEDLLTEILSMFEEQQNAFLNESSDAESGTECDWNEKLFFEMGQEHGFSSEEHVLEEHADTFCKVKKETYTEWGDRLRTEYRKKKYPKQNDEPKSSSEPKLPKMSKNNVGNMDFSRVDELKKKVSVFKLREQYEKECKSVFSNLKSLEKLCFDNIPWPETLKGRASHKSFESMLDDMMEILLFGFTDDDKMKYLKKQQVRWHPDRFLHRCGGRLLEEDEHFILDCVNSFSQKINSTRDALKVL